LIGATTTTPLEKTSKVESMDSSLQEVPDIVEEETSFLNKKMMTLSHYSFVALIVFLILAGLSILSWAILMSKWWALRYAEKSTRKFCQDFVSVSSLDDLYHSIEKYPRSSAKEIFSIGYKDFVRSSHYLKEKNSQDRSYQMLCEFTLDNLARSLQKVKIKEKMMLERFLPFLAIVASAAPFIGLFGTVWGIITAFDAIAQSGSNTLSSIAPGISEALVATALGLVAAIPAVVGYNLAHAKIRNIMAVSESLMSDFISIVQRHYMSSSKEDHQTRGSIV